MSTYYDPAVVAAVQESNKRQSGRLVVLAIVIIIIVIGLAIAIYFILRNSKSLASVNSPQSGGTGGGNNNNTPSTGCTSNDQCSGVRPYCKTETGRCLQCMNDTQCEVYQECRNSNCVTVRPNVLEARYITSDSLYVNWEPVAGANYYVINFDDRNTPYQPGVTDMLPYTVNANVTSATVPSGNAACAPGPNNSFVTVTAYIGAVARVSEGYKLAGNDC